MGSFRRSPLSISLESALRRRISASAPVKKSFVLLVYVRNHSENATFHEGTESIALGAYSHGNHYGIIKTTYGLHQTTKYINAFLKHHGAKGQWTSFQLCHN